LIFVILTHLTEEKRKLTDIETEQAEDDSEASVAMSEQMVEPRKVPKDK